MNSITIPIPPLQRGQHVEIEVTIDGTPRHYEYRVEVTPWTGQTDSDRIDRLRAFIKEQEPNWHLVQIGLPSDDVIPVTFRKRYRTAQPDAQPSE